MLSLGVEGVILGGCTFSSAGGGGGGGGGGIEIGVFRGAELQTHLGLRVLYSTCVRRLRRPRTKTTAYASVFVKMSMLGMLRASMTLRYRMPAGVCTQAHARKLGLGYRVRVWASFGADQVSGMVGAQGCLCHQACSAPPSRQGPPAAKLRQQPSPWIMQALVSGTPRRMLRTYH